MTLEQDDLIQKAASEVAANHRQIIDDWCKAYMAQLYEENGSIKPGDFVLYEQVPSFHPLTNTLVRKYWFEPKQKLTTTEPT